MGDATHLEGGLSTFLGNLAQYDNMGLSEVHIHLDSNQKMEQLLSLLVPGSEAVFVLRPLSGQHQTCMNMH